MFHCAPLLTMIEDARHVTDPELFQKVPLDCHDGCHEPHRRVNSAISNL